MSKISAEMAVAQLFHECGLRTWQDERRRDLVRRSLRVLVLLLSALVLAFVVAWVVPDIIHAIHSGMTGASSLRQSVQRVGAQ